MRWQALDGDKAWERDWRQRRMKVGVVEFVKEPAAAADDDEGAPADQQEEEDEGKGWMGNDNGEKVEINFATSADEVVRKEGSGWVLRKEKSEKVGARGGWRKIPSCV